jgi:CheY-like chemotaxis protein
MTHTTISLNMLTILLLEDNPELTLMLRQVLEWRGYTVVSGTSGHDGLAILHDGTPHPDLILCDLYMPDMDGPTFLQHLRANDEWSHIPVALMSGRDTFETAKEAVTHGANGFLSKPFGLEELDSLLQKCGLKG